MEKIKQLTAIPLNIIFSLMQIVFGSIFIALMAQIAFPLPFTPIHVSMQSLAIMLIALNMKKNTAFYTVIAYLAQATFALPVMANGISNPFWLLGPSGGYLVGFAVAAYLGSFVRSKLPSSFFTNFAVCLLVAAVIFLCGTLWLACLVGPANAIACGVTPFIIGDLYKILFASVISVAIKKL